jgi:aminocarboxymuconate-semialdehyde decarboxylase
MRETVPRAPEEYARRLFYDTLTYSARALRFAIDTFGADRLFLGSDYPFVIKDPDPVASACALDLDDAARAAILEGNAKRFLGL